MGMAVDRARMSDRTTKATRTPSSRIEVSNNILAPLTSQTRFSNQIASNTVISIWTPNWWKTPPIQQQLVPNYKRPLDSTGSIRSSHRVYRAPTSSQGPSFSTTSITRPERSSFSRNCRSGEERSNSSPVTQPHRPGVLQQCIYCPQEGWGVETSNQPKETKCLHSHPSLQDGEYQPPERSPPRRLPSKSRSQGRLFNSTYESSVLEVSALHLERNSVRIQNSPIRSSNGTNNIYKITSPCSSITALSGNTSPHITGRYTASCPDLRYGNPSNVHRDQFTGVSGLHSESEKVHFITFTEPRVSGISNRHNHNVTVTATRQGAEDQEGMPSLPSHVKDHPRQLAHLIGLMTSTSPAVLPAPLRYRMLQMLRSQALSNHQSYDTPIPWTREAYQDLEWWVDQMSSYNSRQIMPKQAEVHLESDASKKGWGAYCRTTQERTGGLWSLQDQKAHINVLELQAAFLTIQSFLKTKRNIHVLIYLDNTVAVQYINHMGGTRSQALCHLVIELWEWCLDRQIILHAEHLPGSLNFRADFERHHSDSSDWRLHHQVFNVLNQQFGPFSTDLFASFQNTHLEHYFSWKPDPQAAGMDALSQPWSKLHPYAFPPFALIGRCLQKVREEKLDHLLLIAPV